MKKTFFFFIFSILSVHADTTLVLSNLASIDMPGYPEALKKKKAEGYTCYFNAFIYEALSEKDPKIKEMNFTDEELDNYYNAYVAQMMKDMDGELRDEGSFFMSGFLGRYIYFEAKNKVGLPQLWHSQIILLDKTVIVVSITAAKGKRKELEWKKDNYFGSLRMFNSSSNVKQGTDDRKPSKNNYKYQEYKKEKNDGERGYLVGQHLVWIITITSISITCTGIAIGLFFLIRRYYKKFDQD